MIVEPTPAFTSACPQETVACGHSVNLLGLISWSVTGFLSHGGIDGGIDIGPVSTLLWSRPVHCRIFSNILGFYPLDAGRKAPVATIKYVSRHLPPGTNPPTPHSLLRRTGL